jgi:hypothetical protein
VVSKPTEVMEKKLSDYLPYYIGQRVQTPDGIGHLVGLNWHIMQNDRVTVHFGHMVKTQNSIDGGYNKTRNHGEYNVRAQRMEPIGSTGVTEDGFDVPGGVTLILRPLSSMTEEEAKEYAGNRSPFWWREHLREEVQSLKIQASNYAYQMDRAKRDRDKAEQESEQLKKDKAELLKFITEIKQYLPSGYYPKKCNEIIHKHTKP